MKLISSNPIHELLSEDIRMFSEFFLLHNLLLLDISPLRNSSLAFILNKYIIDFVGMSVCVCLGKCHVSVFRQEIRHDWLDFICNDDQWISRIGIGSQLDARGVQHVLLHQQSIWHTQRCKLHVHCTDKCIAKQYVIV